MALVYKCRLNMVKQNTVQYVDVADSANINASIISKSTVQGRGAKGRVHCLDMVIM